MSEGADAGDLVLVHGAWRDTLTFWCYRIGVYLVLNVVEDPAWLALAFC